MPPKGLNMAPGSLSCNANTARQNLSDNPQFCQSLDTIVYAQKVDGNTGAIHLSLETLACLVGRTFRTLHTFLWSKLCVTVRQ